MARRRYQKGSVRKRGSRNPVWELQWWADYIAPDKTIQRRRASILLGTVSQMTRRQALKAAEEHLRPLNLGKTTPGSTILFGDFVKRHFVPNLLRTLKVSTQKKYCRTLENHLLPAFGNSRLCDVTTLDLQQFVLAKMDGGLGWESCDLFRNLMSRVFTTAAKWSFFSGENPASGVELPEKTPVREKHVLTPDQIPRLLARLREPVRTMVLLGILTGLRVGEILGMRWKDVDLVSGELRVEQAVYRGSVSSPKTKGSRRTLPLPQTLLSELARLKGHSAVGNEEDLVFRSRTGKPLNDSNLLHRHLKPVGQQIGAPWLNWHTLRRTHATLLQAAGGTLKDAQAQLGHSKLSTTLEVYTIPIPAQQRAAVEKLTELVTNGDELHKFREKLPGPNPLSQRIQ